MISRRGLTAFLPAFLFSTSTLAQEKPKKYFVQVWTEGPAKNEIRDDVDIGRIEVSLNGDFVACAQAKGVKTWDALELAAISIGFIVYGDVSQLKFDVYGELNRTTKLQHKITEV